MGNEIEATPIYPGKLYPQQNKSSYTAGKKARMMRLICKIKENDRRGISNHDTWKENHLKKTHGSHICHHYNARNSCSMQPLALTAPIHAPFAVSCAMGATG